MSKYIDDSIIEKFTIAKENNTNKLMTGEELKYATFNDLKKKTIGFFNFEKKIPYSSLNELILSLNVADSEKDADQIIKELVGKKISYKSSTKKCELQFHKFKDNDVDFIKITYTSFSTDIRPWKGGYG
ncbi:hypothetical protein K9L97_01460 [Candidatus Woesearchaeota archaeon]|nr:hypothetical protein [Candidatus Woesearchaeota archaeon]